MSDSSEEAGLGAEGEHASLDRERAIQVAARELSHEVVLKIGELADRVLGRPELGTMEWVRERAARDTPAGRQRLQEWHLTKMKIQREAELGSYVGDVLNARAAGAGWEAIGQACGMTAETAEQQWGDLRGFPYPATLAGMQEISDVHTTLGDSEDLG